MSSTMSTHTTSDTYFEEVDQKEPLVAGPEKDERPFIRNSFFYITEFDPDTFQTALINRRSFIGFKTPEEAELSVVRRTEFKVYNRLAVPLSHALQGSEVQFASSAPLTIVYRRVDGTHYPIRSIEQPGARRFSVDFGSETSTETSATCVSVSKLLLHYSRTAFTAESHNSEFTVDVFPHQSKSSSGR